MNIKITLIIISVLLVAAALALIILLHLRKKHGNLRGITVGLGITVTAIAMVIAALITTLIITARAPVKTLSEVVAVEKSALADKPFIVMRDEVSKVIDTTNGAPQEIIERIFSECERLTQLFRDNDDYAYAGSSRDNKKFQTLRLYKLKIQLYLESIKKIIKGADDLSQDMRADYVKRMDVVHDDMMTIMARFASPSETQ